MHRDQVVVLAAGLAGRRLFDSVGLATEDVSVLCYGRDKIEGTALYEHLDMPADPDEPRRWRISC